MSIGISTYNESVITGLNNKVDIDLKNSDIEEKIMPIGSTYIQYPNTPVPSELFFGTWSNISNTFAGKFTRIEGGNSASFGNSQNTGLPNITGRVNYGSFSSSGTNMINIGVNYSEGVFYKGLTASGNSPEVVADKGTFYPDTYFDASRSSSIYQNDVTEVRPENITVRIWIRTK